MGSGTQGPASLVGRVVNGYRLERVLGKGATGIVFLGRRVDGMAASVEQTQAVARELPIEAAIKVLVLPWQLDDAERVEFRKRFEREAETLRILKHPHILPIITYGEDEAIDASYMVLPYLPGGSLQERLDDRSRPVTLAEASDLLSQLASAIDFAHHPGIPNIQGIVHRDIKPGNILLDAQGQAFLSDFSIAKIMGQTTTRLTHTGMIPGTPMYMAPEAHAGQLDATPAMDIYSLGMVAYEMVVGLRDQLSASALPAPRTLRPDLPAPVEAAIMQALSPDPALRFPSATAFAEAFAQGLEGRWTPGLTRFVTPQRQFTGDPIMEQTIPDRRPDEPPRRRRMGVLAAAVALLLVVACVAALALPGVGGSLMARLALSATATATGVPGSSSATQTTAPGATHAPGAKPTATAKKSGGGGVVIVGGGGGGATAGPTTVPTATPTPGPPVAIYGDGSDGPLTISSNTTFYPLDATCTGAAGSTSLNFANASGVFAFLSGKPVFILQTQGSGAGAWMQDVVVNSPGTTSGTLTLQRALNANYSAGAQVIVLPQYTNVTINATWSAKPWNGSTGGILAFLANGTVTINGSISASGHGFRAGLGGYAVGNVTGGWGEDQTRPYYDSRNNNDGVNNPGAGVGGGGGGGNTGGSGGRHGGGGGGGYATAGGPGIDSNVAGGATYGTSDLTSIMIFGGGGGGGGASPGNPGYGGGNGGAGGGIIYISAVTMRNFGSIVSNGLNGSPYVSGDNSGGGGGGAGGAILLTVHNPGLGGTAIVANGGSGGLGGAQGIPTPRYGGNGGSGRVLVLSR